MKLLNNDARKSGVTCLEKNVVATTMVTRDVCGELGSTNQSTSIPSDIMNVSDIPHASRSKNIPSRVSCVSFNLNTTQNQSQKPKEKCVSAITNASMLRGGGSPSISTQRTTLSSSSTSLSGSSTLLSKRLLDKEAKWWEKLPPPKKLKAPKIKPTGKKNIDWSQIPPHIEEDIGGKCPEGNWIDCRICKKYAPDCAAVYRTNSITPFSYGNFGKHLTKKPHHINKQKHEFYLRDRRRKDGTAMEKNKKQAMLYSYVQPMKPTKQTPTFPKTSVIFQQQSSPQTTSNLPADKCRGIFSNKQLRTNKVQSGLDFYTKFYAHDSKLLWYVDSIGETSFKSIFSSTCERDSKLEWIEKNNWQKQNTCSSMFVFFM